MLRRPHPTVLAASALVLLGTHGAAAAHWLIVQHESCAAHGQWVHDAEHHDAEDRRDRPGPSAHAAAQGTAAPAAPTAGDHFAPMPAAFSSMPAAHAHDHCAVALLLRERLAPAAAAELAHLANGRAHAVAAFAPATSTRAPAPVLAYAPKSSPPV
ncbi:MAG: hypothetical protein EXR79_08825 [Myxococcales bacterium]|nr:hypothetical protein [Myxococcales bacterium]